MAIGIKQYSIDDINGLYSAVITSAHHLKPWMPWCHASYEIANTSEWVNACITAWNNKSAFRYLIIDTDTQEILGSVGIEKIDWAHRVGELGYWVAAKAINNGVATSAARQLVIAAFESHGLKRIEISVLTDNVASNKVAQKLGATFEGTFRNKLFHNGKSHPANCYSLIPSDMDNSYR